MNHYAGIDVSLEESSVCAIDGYGKSVREGKVPSEPEALIPPKPNSDQRQQGDPPPPGRVPAWPSHNGRRS
jgi:hypothetical protein